MPHDKILNNNSNIEMLIDHDEMNQTFHKEHKILHQADLLFCYNRPCKIIVEFVAGGI